MKDRYYLLGSKHNRLSDPHQMFVSEEWEQWVKREWQCPGSNGQFCHYPRREIQDQPVPLEPTVEGAARGFSRVLPDPVIAVFRDDARELFDPYLSPRTVWGRVYTMLDGERVPTDYSTCQMPRFDEVEMDRGTSFIAPHYCEMCKRAFCWAPDCRHMGILRWQIRDRPVLMANRGDLAVHPEFFEDMKLKERFPDLKVVHKIKIYDRDPHGWVLPDDPDWDGVFRKPPGWIDPVTEPIPTDEEILREWEAEQAAKQRTDAAPGQE
jgi:hypothetical protein